MSDDLLRSLLRQVSRSFYLSLAILPAALREPIGLAYLLARAADSVADTRLLPRRDRLAHLQTLRRAFAGEPGNVAAVGRACAPHRPYPAEQHLLERVDEAVARLERLESGDRDQVRQVLATLTNGMVFDLTRFAGEDASAIDALDTLEELDHYTYLIAGCVGPFWTALHRIHRPRLRHWDLSAMSARAVRFGKALQLTNILRDVPADLRSGRCYLPARELLALGLSPPDLLDPGARRRARPLLRRLLGLALDHYEVGWQYTLAIPRLEWRMRLACAWPLMIGLATLRDLAAHPDPLGAASPIKIGRREIRAILARSLIAVWSDAALGAEATRARRRVAV
ncbi:MAG TPA: phytoene/squalene synthase family protein [Methylomirabilota bacterium]|jgi:farnesyl-diphosphate farnesyltransferase